MHTDAHVPGSFDRLLFSQGSRWLVFTQRSAAPCSRLMLMKTRCGRGVDWQEREAGARACGKTASAGPGCPAANLPVGQRRPSRLYVCVGIGAVLEGDKPNY